MRPVLTDEEKEALWRRWRDELSVSEVIDETERQTRERMAAHIEKLEAVVAALLLGLKVERDPDDAFRWRGRGPGERLREAERNAQVILAAEHGEEER